MPSLIRGETGRVGRLGRCQPDNRGPAIVSPSPVAPDAECRRVSAVCPRATAQLVPPRRVSPGPVSPSISPLRAVRAGRD